MDISIKNCNNINEGNISIKENNLNIKFGINGTGKSTIAKAIQYHSDPSKNLTDLTPFKLIGSIKEEDKPKIEGIENIKKVLVFNEDYIKDILFLEDEEIKNSFDIFMKTPGYNKQIEIIDSKVEKIKNIFKENEKLLTSLEDFKNISSSFTLTGTGTISGSSKGPKAFKEGNILENISDKFNFYKDFLKSDLEKRSKWLDWHKKGNIFLDLSNLCPYCALPIEERKNIIREFNSIYNKTKIEHLVSLLSAFDNQKEYFSENAILSLDKIKKNGLDENGKDFIINIKKEIDVLVDKLNKLRNLSFDSFNKSENHKDFIESLIMKIESSDLLYSEKTKKLIIIINKSLRDVLGDVSNLEKEIETQRKVIKDTIEKHEKDINCFLKNAGYKYEVYIHLTEEDNYKLKLKHVDLNKLPSKSDNYLSFGERNAFALALFMYQAISKKTDLIILDDPISSFDQNKKYAIMDMLFNQEKCLKDETVLMLTHDQEPIIDSIKIFHKIFRSFTNVNFLELKDDKLIEKTIRSDNILTFPKICDEIIKDNTLGIITKLIYLRRDFEVKGERENEYQIISNLLKKNKREDMTDKRDNKDDFLSEVDFISGSKGIKDKISDFDYEKILLDIENLEIMKKLYFSSKNSYEKLHLFRIIKKEEMEDYDNIFQNFIDKSYHIENELIYQLDPRKFDLIPEFIIKRCDEIIKSI